MNLRKAAETDLAVTLEWDPVPAAAGFIYSIDDDQHLADGKRHFTFDGSTTSIKIGKPQDGKPHSFEVTALGALDKGSVTIGAPTPPPPPSSGGVVLPTRDHFIVGPDSIACRQDYASPITGPRTRWWELEPGFQAPSWVRSVGNLGREVWILMSFQVLPGDWCGRILDGHNEPTDTDIQDHATPPNPPGTFVSAFAIDHNATTDEKAGGKAFAGLMYTVEPEGDDHGNPYHFAIMSDAQARERVNHVKIHLTLGRRGSSTPGAIRIWDMVRSPRSPVVDLSGISTIWGNQSVMHFLQGPYNFHKTAAVRMAATRFGRTEQEAYADVQVTYQGDIPAMGPKDYSMPSPVQYLSSDFPA